MNDPNITNYIIEIVLNDTRPFILGSQLGGKVKQKFPHFEQLKRYIEQNCAGQIALVGRYGTDFAFAHISRLDQINNAQPISSSLNPPCLNIETIENKGEPNRLAARLAQSPTPWTVFTNPNVDERLAIDTNTNELQCIPRDGVISPPLVEIPKVTLEEHQKIASDFLPKIDLQDQNNFQQSPGIAIAWSSWSSMIKQFAEGKYFHVWLDHRTECIRVRLAERLINLGILEGNVESIINRLVGSKKRRPPRTVSAANVDQLPRFDKQNLSSENELRRIAIIAISEISIDELRRLSFPLGAILNALKK